MAFSCAHTYDSNQGSGYERILLRGAPHSNLDTNRYFRHKKWEPRTATLVRDLPPGTDYPGYNFSRDGRFVVCATPAHLTPEDGPDSDDVFRIEVATGNTQLVDANDQGQAGNRGASAGVQRSGPGVSADGRYVLFTSASTNLVANDTNGLEDVFLKDLNTRSVRRVSVGAGGVQADGASGYKYVSLSADGNLAAFNCHANNLVAGTLGFEFDCLRSLATGTNQALEGNSSDVQMVRLSDDGRFVSYSRRGVAVVRDRVTQQTTSLSLLSNNPDISGDGRFIVIDTPNRLVPEDLQSNLDVYVMERETRAVRLLSLTPQGLAATGDSLQPRISQDGRWVVFESTASNLVPGDNNGQSDIFLARNPLAP